jgi:SHS2 domain-containing protein
MTTPTAPSFPPSPGTTARFEHFAHGADVGIRGLGESPAEAFAQAARALTAVTCDLASVAVRETIDVELEGRGLDDLFFAWIDALVFFMATRRMVFSSFQVELVGDHLRAKVGGESLRTHQHAPSLEVKAPTFSSLSVQKRDDGMWVAQCVVDV